MTIDCDFPGGNILVDAIDGDDIFVRQDLRDTEGQWFYWYFRVQGAAGRRLNVHFTNGEVFGSRGPAVSVDGGKQWRWVDDFSRAERRFAFAVPEDVHDVRFAFAVPYTEADLTAFLSRHKESPHLVRETLCSTPTGREVELLRLGHLDGDPDARVLVTGRHHACETMASFTVEGMIEAFLENAWLREHVEMLVIPFMDKDGVEAGDQGKNRAPQDHNRDYSGESIYAETRALRAYAPQWGDGRLRVALDVHCPWRKGPSNEELYLVGSASPEMWAEQQKFSGVLERVATGPLEYCMEDNLPFGKGWNVDEPDGKGDPCAQWAGGIPGVRLSATLEIPYATARGREVTPHAARAFGRDLTAALRVYLEEGMKHT